MKIRQISGEGLTQVRPAEILCIEGLSRAQGGNPGFANKGRRGSIGFPKPEWQNIFAAHGRIGHGANQRGRKPRLCVLLFRRPGQSSWMHGERLSVHLNADSPKAVESPWHRPQEDPRYPW